MLRQLTNDHVAPFLVGFNVTGPATVNYGVADLVPSTISSGGTGQIDFDFRDPYRRAVTVVAPYQSIANGALAQNFSALNNGAYFVSADNTGVAAAGRMNSLTLGWRNPQVDIVRPQLVNGLGGSQMRIMGGRFDSDATVAVGRGDFSAVKTATGAYTVTFKNAFGEPPIVIPTAIDSSTYINVVAVAANQVTITTWNAVPAAVDAGFHLIVYGAKGPDEMGRIAKPVMATQRKPRILGFRVDYSGGVPAYGIGGTDATGNPTDNGTGDYTITFAKPFRRPPVIAACMNAAAGFGTCKVESVSATTVRIWVYNTAAALVDQNSSVIVLGSDDPSEY